MKFSEKDIDDLLANARAKATAPQEGSRASAVSDVDLALESVKARLREAVAATYSDAVNDVREERDRLEISTDPDERPEAIHFTVVLAFLRQKLGELQR